MPSRNQVRFPRARAGARVAAVCVALLVHAAGARAGVLLNEILADPAADWDGSGAYQSRDDEWVEIVNTGPDPVDLAGYRLAGADSSWRFEFSGVLAPGAVQVVFGSESYAWEQDTGNPAYGLRLSNTGGAISLWRLTGPDTLLVDCYGYQDHEAEDDRSSGRMPDGGPDWELFDGLNPYTGDTAPLASGCVPSPGATISCPTPVRPTTWGRVKQIENR